MSLCAIQRMGGLCTLYATLSQSIYGLSSLTRANEVIDDAGETDDSRVKTAAIMLVGYYYRNPDQDPDQDFALGMLPKPVSSMLYQLRDPIAR